MEAGECSGVQAVGQAALGACGGSLRPCALHVLCPHTLHYRFHCHPPQQTDEFDVYVDATPPVVSVQGLPPL